MIHLHPAFLGWCLGVLIGAAGLWMTKLVEWVRDARNVGYADRREQTHASPR